MSISSYKCAKCSNIGEFGFHISCNHYICLDCAQLLIDNNDYKTCPLCKNTLATNLHTIFADFLISPVGKLIYHYDFLINDTLWYYAGNNHNWLYSKEDCNILNNAFMEYQDKVDDTSDSDSISEDISKCELTVGPNSETYVIDFNKEIQYPKKFPNKVRTVSNFVFNNMNSIDNKKIIGVAGQKF